MELLTDHIEAAHPGEKILATMSLPADDIATPQDTGTVDVVEVTNDIQQEEGVAIENGMAGWSSDNSGELESNIVTSKVVLGWYLYHLMTRAVGECITPRKACNDKNMGKSGLKNFSTCLNLTFDLYQGHMIKK